MLNKSIILGLLLSSITQTQAVSLLRHHKHYPGVRFEQELIDINDLNGMAADPDLVLEAIPELDPVSSYNYMAEPTKPPVNAPLAPGNPAAAPVPQPAAGKQEGKAPPLLTDDLEASPAPGYQVVEVPKNKQQFAQMKNDLAQRLEQRNQSKLGDMEMELKDEDDSRGGPSKEAMFMKHTMQMKHDENEFVRLTKEAGELKGKNLSGDDNRSSMKKAEDDLQLSQDENDLSKIIDDEHKLLAQQTITEEKMSIQDYEYKSFVEEKLERDQMDGSKMSEEERDENQRLQDSNTKIQALIQKDAEASRALHQSRSGPENSAVLAVEEAEAKFDKEQEQRLSQQVEENEQQKELVFNQQQLVKEQTDFSFEEK